MAPQFIFPQTLQTLEQEDTSNFTHLTVQNPIDLSSFRPSQLEEFVKGVSFDLSDKELFCIEDPEVFDRVYSLVNGFNSLTPGCKFNLVESLRSNFSVLLPNVDSLSRASINGHVDGDDDDNDENSLIERVASHRNAFKIYTFFLVHIVLLEEANSSSNANPTKVATNTRKKQFVNLWNWEPQRGRILTLIANSLEINLPLLFGSSDPDENYLSFIVKNAFIMFESPTMLKDSTTRDALSRIIGTCATKYHYTPQSCASIMHLIHKYDFVVPHLAEAVAISDKKYSDSTLCTSLIREIGRTNPKDYIKDTVGAENVGRFIIELADKLPKLISTNIGLLVPHFGGESYKIRNALVGVLGKLVAKAFNDIESEVSSKSIRLKTKQAMLQILLERCRDVSAYTRSKVLQVWSELCEEHLISIGLWNEVAEIASNRLLDKSAFVRKSALNLLIAMLQHNPFGPQLRKDSFKATLEQYKKKLNELEPRTETEEEEDNEEVKVGSTKEEENSLTDSCIVEVENVIDPTDNNNVPDVGNLEQTRTLVASLEAGLRFSNCLSENMPVLVQLMASSSASDVENTILLLMRCKQFLIDGSEACLRKMLPLVFSQDKSIYEAVENAFISIYLRKNPLETGKNLSNLAVASNIGDLAALEFIISALVSKGDITSTMLSALWDLFSFNISGTTAEQSRGALSIICMAAKTNNNVLTSHIQEIIDIGFGKWAKIDPLLARTACIALQRLSEEDKNKMLMNISGTRVFDILESLVLSSGISEDIWYSATDKAISTIYYIHPTPEIIAANLVKKLVNSVFGEINESESESDVQVTKLSRFLFVVSHVAMNQLVYIENCVRKILKQRVKKDKMMSQNDSSNDSVKKDDGINAELGVTASEDAIIDSLSEKAQKEILSDGCVEKHLIGYCGPFLSKLCRNFGLMQKYPELQASGMLALCRFMIIDADFCASNLQLLFTVVESSPSEIVRSNCTIALGDLAVRFPNLLEPWTENTYARLKDPSLPVRKNAVLVLSHLILNDMMKVKGYIYEMAIRLEDEDERISSLAKLFFNELAKKGNNPIYNLLPDILGKLSTQNLKEDSFCNIMQFLINSIKKDKQMESLVEKLCNRFSGVTDMKQWEYISYCLSQLAFTEKSMKKLIDAFKTYEHVLSNDTVMDHFRSIITKGKKFAKPELKLCIEEFEEKINKFHSEKKEQDITAKNALAHQQKLNNLEALTKNDVEEEITESELSQEKTDNEAADVSKDGSSDEVLDSKNIESEILDSKLKSKIVESEVVSNNVSELTETELDENEVQSPRPTVVAKSKAQKSRVKTKEVVPMRSTRSRRRVEKE